MKKNKTLEMVQLAVLIAIMLILAFTPQAEPYWDWYSD